MDEDSERDLPLQAYGAEEAASEVDDEKMRDLIIGNIDTVVSSTEIDAAVKIQLISYYVRIKYRDFAQTGYAGNIADAIEKQRVVLDLTKQDSEDLGWELDFLGFLLGLRYERLGGGKDLDEAIKRADEAVRVTPTNHPDLAAMLNNVGNKLETRYKRTGLMADLENAIEQAEEAVRMTPTKHPDLAMYRNNLGSKLERRYERTGQMADLEKAIEQAEEAVLPRRRALCLFKAGVLWKQQWRSWNGGEVPSWG